MWRLLVSMAAVTLLVFVGTLVYDDVVFHDFYVNCEGNGSAEFACFTGESEVRRFMHDATKRGMTQCRIARFGKCPRRS
jgi:hypothetical protein